VDKDVVDYINAIAPEHQELFDRIHTLIIGVCPEVVVQIAYGIPTYRSKSGQLHLGAWKHGISIYGWKRRGDGGFLARHPELQTSTGTIRLQSKAEETVSDDDICDLVRAALVI
jgi:uncharacterized protein YdhG (YjbR/CyaY superfamily)